MAVHLFEKEEESTHLFECITYHGWNWIGFHYISQFFLGFFLFCHDIKRIFFNEKCGFPNSFGGFYEKIFSHSNLSDGERSLLIVLYHVGRNFHLFVLFFQSDFNLASPLSILRYSKYPLLCGTISFYLQCGLSLCSINDGCHFTFNCKCNEEGVCDLPCYYILSHSSLVIKFSWYFSRTCWGWMLFLLYFPTE